MTYSHILVPVAFGEVEHSRQALDLARANLAPGGRITLLHAVDIPPPYVMQYVPEGVISAKQHEIRDEMTEILGDTPNSEAVTVEGAPGRAIAAWARDHDVDLIVLHSHRPGPADLVWGSTAAYVVRHVTCSVHVLR